jgi:plastocyanin
MLERGFLGTNASLLSDVSLSLGVLVALTLTVGVIMARRKKIQAHRWIQSTAVTLNVMQVLVVMVGSFMKSAAPGVPSRVGEPYYAVAIIHGLLGLGTLLLGVFIAIRANELLPPFLHRLRFHNFKLFMRTAYGLYMLSTALGVAVYFVWYGPGRPAESPRVAAAADEIVVPMANFEFSPREIIVPVGSTIIWLNQDAAPHTATADDGRAFNSDLVANGQSFSLTLLDVGEFSYFCELHGSAGGIGMAGKITVVAGDQAPRADVAAPRPVLLQTPTPTPSANALGLPIEAGTYVNYLLVDGPGLPIKQGYVVGLRRETQELLRHARLLSAAEATGDLAAVRRQAELALTAIDGSPGAEHIGLLPNGDQPGYIRATAAAAQAALDAPDASNNIVIHADHVLTVSTENMLGWATEARGLALGLTRVTELGDVTRPASRLLVLAKWLDLGNDLNGDGELSPVVGEGGGLVAYEHSRFMAGLGPSLNH